MANEIKVPLVLDDEPFKEGLDDAEEQAVKSGTKIGKKLGDKAQQFSQKGLGLLKSRILQLGALFVASFGSRAIIQAAIRQEDAVKRLNTSLKLAGEFSRAASEDIQAFATELQRSTAFGDEYTLELFNMARAFTKTNNEAKALVKAGLDLSEAMGVEATSAIRNLGKSTSGLLGELGELLPAARGLTAEQLRAGAAIDLVAKRFGGAAQENVKTFGGLLSQLSNNFGDFLESLGFIITKSPAVLGFMQSLSATFAELADSLKGLTIDKLLNDLVVFLARATAGVITFFTVFQFQAIKAFLSAQAQAVKLKIDLGLLKTQITTTALQFKFFAGVVVSSMSAARVATLALKATIQATKIALTLGLIVVIDQIVEKFVLFKQSGMSAGDAIGAAFKVLLVNVKIIFREITNTIITQLTKIPIVGKKIGESTKAFVAINKNALVALRAERDELLRPITNTNILGDPQQFKSSLDSMKMDVQLLRENFRAQFPRTFRLLSREQQMLFDADIHNMNKEQLEQLKQTFTEMTETTKAKSKEINDSLTQNLGNGISAGIQRVAGALVKGEDAFEAFGGAILGILGDLAIQLGQFYLMQGLATLAMFNVDPSGSIALGLGLIALGGILKAFSGSGGASAATAGGGGTAGGGTEAVNSPTTSFADTTAQEPRTEVKLIVEGNVLDRKETASELLTGLKEFTDDQGGGIVFT